MGGFHQKGYFWAKKGPRGDFGLGKVWFPVGVQWLAEGAPETRRGAKSQFSRKIHFVVKFSENGGIP